MRQIYSDLKSDENIINDLLLSSMVAMQPNPLQLSSAYVQYYFNLFKDNEISKKKGLPPQHRIYKKLKYIRPIKRKVLFKEIMKM